MYCLHNRQSKFKIPAAMFKSVVTLLSVAFVSSGLEAPIIGILSQETYIVSHLFPGEHHDSYIAASYVKYIESAGGRVVPVWIGQSDDYYKRIINYTNGILFPGGGTFFNETGGYGDAARRIYQIVVDTNKRGVYYPVWGSCLGMQVLPFDELNGTDIRVNCILQNVAVSLNFTKGYDKSKLFSKAPKNIINSLSNREVTYNYHRYCLTERVLKENNIISNWKILSTNEDNNQLEFISSMESVDYPIYGVQFHPEKNPFEFAKTNVPHTRASIEVSQYFARFFVGESKKNNNRFPNEQLEKRSLIYNYNPIYTGLKDKSIYEQIYLFNITDFNAVQLV